MNVESRFSHIKALLEVVDVVNQSIRIHPKFAGRAYGEVERHDNTTIFNLTIQEVTVTEYSFSLRYNRGYFIPSARIVDWGEYEKQEHEYNPVQAEPVKLADALLGMAAAVVNATGGGYDEAYEPIAEFARNAIETYSVWLDKGKVHTAANALARALSKDGEATRKEVRYRSGAISVKFVMRGQGLVLDLYLFPVTYVLAQVNRNGQDMPIGCIYDAEQDPDYDRDNPPSPHEALLKCEGVVKLLGEKLLWR